MEKSKVMLVLEGNLKMDTRLGRKLQQISKIDTLFGRKVPNSTPRSGPFPCPSYMDVPPQGLNISGLNLGKVTSWLNQGSLATCFEQIRSVLFGSFFRNDLEFQHHLWY